MSTPIISSDEAAPSIVYDDVLQMPIQYGSVKNPTGWFIQQSEEFRIGGQTLRHIPRLRRKHLLYQTI